MFRVMFFRACLATLFILILYVSPPATSDEVFQPAPVSDSISIMLERGAEGMDRFVVSVSGFKEVIKAGLERAGYHVMGSFPAADAYLVSGRWEDLEKLRRVPGVVYVEWDSPAELDLEVSTAVINASQVWYSYISWEGMDLSPSGIDGEGVTIVVVDTGIDAGHPDLGYGDKTIMNLKADTPFGPWIPMENSDTSYGHGTHCAGIAAGSGVASAGARRGVAPGANLIGLSVGDVGIEDLSMSNYLGGLQWVYDHSRPGANIYNIRVVTNSWHTSVGEYDPSSALTRIVERLTFENNVVVVFSAGNDGRMDPEGKTITTSQQGNTPCAIMVAAYARDGSYVADFSSRGRVGMPQTYPDVGAPGVRIWAPQARRTVISAGSWLSNTNPYYVPLSGTSMSTPHVAGSVALLFQACPSLKISEVHEDYEGPEEDDWMANPLTRVHEVEVILEASARLLPEDKEHGVVSQDDSRGLLGKKIDYVQGYGIVDLRDAVGIALTLRKLRNTYGPDVSVLTAIEVYKNAVRCGVRVPRGVHLTTAWEGIWSRYNQQAGKDELVQNQTRDVYIPRGVRRIHMTLDYQPYSISNLQAGYITYVIDYNRDGRWDKRGPLMDVRGGLKTYEIEVLEGQDGKVWRFGIVGEGFKIMRPLKENSYVEVKISYTILLSVVWEGHPLEETLHFPESGNIETIWMPESSDSSGELLLNLSLYDMSKVYLGEEGLPRRGEEFPLLPIILLIALLASFSAYLFRRRSHHFFAEKYYKKRV